MGGGEELELCGVRAGRADIPDAEAQKLDKLVKALYERPALNLEIAGSFDPEKDRAALARLKLEQQLKVLRLRSWPTPVNRSRAWRPFNSNLRTRERLLKQVFTELGTNQTLVLQAAAAAPDHQHRQRRFPRAA